MTGQRILVTGGTGMVGRPLVAALCAAGNQVTVLCRKPPAEGDSLSDCGPTYLAGDVSLPFLGLDHGRYHDLAGSLDTIFHLAARTDFKGGSVAEYQAINIEGVRQVYDLSVRAGAHLHHVSTAFVRGNHAGIFRETDLDLGQGFRNGYEKSKFLGERFLHERMGDRATGSQPPVTIYRPSIILERRPSQASLNTFGPFIFLDGVFRILLANSRRGLDNEIVRVRGSIDCSLPFIFDDDVVDALVRIAASPGIDGRTFHLVSAQPFPNRMLEEVFNAAFGRPVARMVGHQAFEEQPASTAEKLLARKTAIYDTYLDLDLRFDRSQLDAFLGPDWRPAISTEELLTAFSHFLASKSEEDANAVLRPLVPLRLIDNYFEQFLPAFFGQQLLTGLASLSCHFWLDIADCTSRTLTIDHGRLVGITSGQDGAFGYRVRPATFLNVVGGLLSPQQGFFQGAISMEGNTMEALRTATALEEFFRTWPYTVAT